MRRSRRLLVLGCASLALAACANGAPLRIEAHLDRSTISPNGDGSGDTSTLTYVLSRPARVDVAIVATDGDRFPLRTNEPRPAGDYHLVLDGTYPLAGEDGQRRVLSDGAYQVALQARAAEGERASATASLEIRGADTERPQLDPVAVAPSAISPNFDGIDDQVVATFGLSKAAAVSFVVEDQTGRKVDGVTLGLRGPGEYRETWNAVVNGRPLPDGLYRFSVVTRDAAGNTTTSITPLTVAGSGIPRARILRADFRPHQLLLGGYVEVRIKVKNVGATILRSQGPDPGFAYGSYETFGSIAQGEFIDRLGRWRAGADLSDGQPSEGHGLWLPGDSRPASAATPGARYPYRWGFGRDLQPGEDAEATGEIQLWHRIPTLWLFAGLIQEGIRFHDDGAVRSVVNVTL